jgi:hypothetical protein
VQPTASGSITPVAGALPPDHAGSSASMALRGVGTSIAPWPWAPLAASSKAAHPRAMAIVYT